MARRATLRLALLAAVAAALAAPAAEAAQTAPGTAHASARTERLSLSAADSYWLARGLAACPSPRIEYAALTLRAAGDAFIGPGLSPAHCVIRVSARRAWRGRAAAIDFCWTVVHERGHQAGRTHAAAGLMREDGGDRPPSICARAFGLRAG
jgi:hypothetical protein